MEFQGIESDISCRNPNEPLNAKECITECCILYVYGADRKFIYLTMASISFVFLIMLLILWYNVFKIVKKNS